MLRAPLATVLKLHTSDLSIKLYNRTKVRTSNKNCGIESYLPTLLFYLITREYHLLLCKIIVTREIERKKLIVKVTRVSSTVGLAGSERLH